MSCCDNRCQSAPGLKPGAQNRLAGDPGSCTNTAPHLPSISSPPQTSLRSVLNASDPSFCGTESLPRSSRQGLEPERTLFSTALQYPTDVFVQHNYDTRRPSSELWWSFVTGSRLVTYESYQPTTGRTNGPSRAQVSMYCASMELI